MHNQTTFSRKWQQFSETNHLEAQARLAQEGIYFFNAENAFKWEQLRNDIRDWQKLGQENMVEELMMDSAAIAADDDKERDEYDRNYEPSPESYGMDADHDWDGCPLSQEARS